MNHKSGLERIPWQLCVYVWVPNVFYADRGPQYISRNWPHRFLKGLAHEGRKGTEWVYTRTFLVQATESKTMLLRPRKILRQRNYILSLCSGMFSTIWFYTNKKLPHQTQFAMEFWYKKKLLNKKIRTWRKWKSAKRKFLFSWLKNVSYNIACYRRVGLQKSHI